MSQLEILEYSEKMLAQVVMLTKKHALVNTLSGGQKRKLQLLIALAGDT